MVSSVLAQAILSQKAPDIVGSFREGQEIGRQGQIRELSAEVLRTGGQGLDELAGVDPQIAMSLGETIRARNAQDINDFVRDAKIGLNKLNAGDNQGALQFAQQRRNAISQRGGDTSHTDQVLGLMSSGDFEGAKQSLMGFVGAIDQAKKSAKIQEFEFLTEGLSPEQIQKAKEVDLGLRARQGISPEEFGQRERAKLTAQKELKPEIKGLEKTAEGQAALSTKIVAKSFDSIGKARKNIGNIDRAISALDKGAKTGAIERFLPSVKAASVELDQIRNELGLDVIGGVTFGALSEGELNLALSTALPTGLNEAELRDFLVRKRDAQSKTIVNLNEAVQFLSKPNATIADFIQSKQSAGDTVQTPQKTISVDF